MQATAALPQHDTVIRALLQAGMLTSGSAVQYRVSTQQPGNTAVQDRMRTEPPGPDQEALAEAQVQPSVGLEVCCRFARRLAMLLGSMCQSHCLSVVLLRIQCFFG